MKRPMFKMGGPTSGGTGITSGLETPRQNFKYGTYGEAVQAIPAMFEKTMTGLENKRSAIGPMALLQAAASGAFTDVDSSHINSDAINYVEVEGIVNGYPDGSYQPDR